MYYKFLILLVCIFASCTSSKNIVYLQDASDGTTDQVSINNGIVIQPKDMLSVVVSSRNPELAVAFNLPLIASYAGSALIASGESQKMLGYIVDMEGNIDFPIFGKMHVVGLTRHQLAHMIKQKLTMKDLIKDPVITIEILNFRVSVLGEVNSPGTINVNGDRITILEALSMAGDLTIHGKRDNILVRREIDNIVSYHRVDLRSRVLHRSPVYYLQQNDVVYVEPNKVRVGQSNINENRSLGLLISIVSLLTSATVLFIK